MITPFVEKNIPIFDFDYFNQHIKCVSDEEYNIFQTLTLEQKWKFINLNEKERFLIFMITLPLSDAYKVFFNMKPKHQQAFLTLGKINTCLEFIYLEPFEKDYFLTLPVDLYHEVAKLLHLTRFYKMLRTTTNESIYTNILSPEQIIYNFKKNGQNASRYEIYYLQPNNSLQRYEIKLCDNCGYTIHTDCGEKSLKCKEC